MAKNDLVLLTGASGFIGFGILYKALQQGYRVRAVVRAQDSIDKISSNQFIKELNLASNVLAFAIVPDFTVPGAFDEAVQSVKYVFHVAAPNPAGTRSSTIGAEVETSIIKPAVQGTSGLLESAYKEKTVKKVIMTASMVSIVSWGFIIGTEKQTGSITSDSRATVPEIASIDNPLLAYVVAKTSALNEAEKWAKEKNPSFDVIQITPSLVLGEDLLATEAQQLLASGTNAMVLNQAVGVHEKDPNMCTTIALKDVVRGHLRTLDDDISGHQVILMSTQAKYDDIGKIVEKYYPKAAEEGILSTTGSRTTLPLSLDWSGAEKVLGFKFASFEEQMRETIDYYLKLKSRGQ